MYKLIEEHGAATLTVTVPETEASQSVRITAHPAQIYV